jgi:tagatose 6-phosphate kinase
MRKYVLTVTLNPAVDKTVMVPGFRTGRDFREQGFSVSAGGKGINVSRVLNSLGISNVATGFLGGSDGDYIKRQLMREKIRYDFCPIKANTRTSLTIIDPLNHNITRVLERGPRVSKSELEAFRNKFHGLLEQASCVIISGRNIPGAPDSFYARLIALAKKKKVIAVFDTSSRPYELGLKKKPFMIKPNLKEAEATLGRVLSRPHQIKKAACALQEKGIPVVAITMGSKGAIVYDGSQMLEAAAPKVKGKSPVGCGDAFIAGFIASYIGNKNLKECLKMAVACGAANALSINPGFISPGAIRKIFRKVKIQRI